MITATDAVGNKGRLVVEVGVAAEAAPCPTVSPSVQDPVHTVTPTVAQASAVASIIAPSQSTYDAESESTVDPSLARPDNSPPTPLDVTGTLTDDTVASQSARGATVEDVACLIPTQTTAVETDASIVNGDAALNANAAADTDTITRPTGSGEAIIESIRGSAAPQSFSWKVGIQEGTQLEPLSNGAIAITDPLQAVPPDIVVPNRPANAQDPAAIGDPVTQLAETRFQVANAERETGNEVVGVITPPYIVDSAGTSRPTNLTLTAPDTIRVTSAPDARAVVVNVVARRSRYVTTVYCRWCRLNPAEHRTNGTRNSHIRNQI